MTGPLEDLDDDELLAALGEVLAIHTGPPREVVEVAKELYTWRTVDAELAALTYDSLLDDGPVLARAAAQPPRILTFEADGLTIEVEVDAGPGGRRLLGQLIPAQVARIEMRGGGGSATASADEMGRFTIALPVTSERVVLTCLLADGQSVRSATAFL